MDGWIKLHRSMVEWEWYTDPNTSRLFMHLLLTANHSDGKWRGQEVKAGSTITGRVKLSSELGMSEQAIRTSLNKLKSTSEITIKPSNKYSIISITNWDLYQATNQQDNQQATNKQPTTNQQLTTNKNDNNEKNVRKIFTPPKFEEVKAYCDERKNNVDPEGFIDHYETNGWMRGKTKVKDWKACIRTWEKNSNGGNETNRGFSNLTGAAAQKAAVLERIKKM